jgi:FMN phosphatase YigB (HAD superfamily)
MNDERPRVRLLVTDLDNTLYDWFHIWHSSFAALLDEVARVSGIPPEVLRRDARIVHQRHRTSEYSFLLNELECLRRLHATDDIAGVYAEAIHSFRSVRKRATSLYPTVMESLVRIQETGVPVVAYTDSLAFQSFRRVKALDLDGVIAAMYSPPDHAVPDGVSLSEIRSQGPTAYEFEVTVRRELPPGAAKPDPTVLKQICSDFGTSPEETAYVGDSLMKDVAMAQAVGAVSVWAEYGVSHDRAGYDLLRAVSHWTDEDIARERELARLPTVEATITLRENFAEILDVLEFEGTNS